jgi:replicative DNA helicase
MTANVHYLPAPRAIPYNAEAEMGLLGAILTTNKAMERVVGFLKAEHFYDPLHALIFEAAAKIIDKGGVVDPVTLGGHFSGDAAFDTVGGSGYLGELAGSVVSIVNAEHYGKLIFECAKRRRLMDVGHDLLVRASISDLSVTADDVLSTTENQLFELAETGSTSKPRKLIEFVNEHLDDVRDAQSAPDGIVGLTTGLFDLDAKLKGLKAPDLIVLAGRPAMGKTALALNIAKSVSYDRRKRGKPLFISEEMSGKQLAARLISDLTGISVQDQFSKLEPQQLRQIAEAKELLRDADLWIEDTPNLSVAKVRSMARRHKRRYGLDLLIVDYLQLLNGGETRFGNRTEEVSIISRGLKAIAKELHVPVIALSQLSRAVEQREDKRPVLSDLRESGSIEQDADIILFPFRLEYYLAKEEPIRRDNETDDKFALRRKAWFDGLEECAGKAEVIIAKFRQGATDSVKVGFDGARTRFYDLQRGEW